MNKMTKKVLNTSLVVAMLASINTGTPVLANTIQDTNVERSALDYSQIEQMSCDDLMTELESMTDEQLVQYVDYLTVQSEQSEVPNTYSFNNISSKSRSLSTPNAIQQIWLAGAQYLKNQGYTCAGTLLQYSVNNYSYKENCPFGADGLCSSKIVNTTAFKNYYSKVKNNKSLPSGISFESSDSKDLFLALHKVNISTRSSGVAFSPNNFTISDTYDFDYNSYKDVLLGVINNAAWLSQNAGYLHKIPVTILFVK